MPGISRASLHGSGSNSAGFGQNRSAECSIVIRLAFDGTAGSDWENGLSSSFQLQRKSRMPGRRGWMQVAVVLCLLIGSMAGARPAPAQDELKIAAVINDDVITQLDVVARLRAAMLSARLEDTPETRQHLLPNVMRSLIDEHLKAQEA